MSLMYKLHVATTGWWFSATTIAKILRKMQHLWKVLDSLSSGITGYKTWCKGDLELQTSRFLPWTLNSAAVLRIDQGCLWTTSIQSSPEPQIFLTGPKQKHWDITLLSSTWIRGKTDLEVSEARRSKKDIPLLIHGTTMKHMGDTLI